VTTSVGDPLPEHRRQTETYVLQLEHYDERDRSEDVCVATGGIHPCQRLAVLGSTTWMYIAHEGFGWCKCHRIKALESGSDVYYDSNITCTKNTLSFYYHLQREHVERHGLRFAR
jgi:hypothetical protein